MSEQGAVIHGFIREQGCLTAEPCQKENLFAAAHRQKMAAQMRSQSGNLNPGGKTRLMLMRLPAPQRCLMTAVI